MGNTFEVDWRREVFLSERSVNAKMIWRFKAANEII
jgi:hypothetical protein